MKVPIHVKVDDWVKLESEDLFDSLGMNMTTAITLFLNQCVAEQGLPFKPMTREGILISKKDTD